jgi:hypothetical protein
MTKPLVPYLFLVYALAIITAAQAIAWNEPAGFREYSFGMSRDEVDSLLRAGGPG